MCICCRVEVRSGASEFSSNSFSKLSLVGVRVYSSLWDDFAADYIAGHKYLNDVPVGEGAGAVVDFILYMMDGLQLTYAAVRHHLTNLRAVFTIYQGHGAIFD